MDDHTVLAVHSLLDSQVFATDDAGNSSPTDEDDVFQCGKCKKQFTSILSFINHKKETCRPSSSSGVSLSAASLQQPVIQQNSVVVGKIQVPSSPLSASAYGQTVVSTESDIFSLGPECKTNQVTEISSPIQVQPLNSVIPESFTTDPAVTSLQPVYSEVQDVKDVDSLNGAISFPLLGSKFISGPLILVSQSSDMTNLSSLVLNITSPDITSEAVVEEIAQAEEIPEAALEARAEDTTEEEVVNETDQNVPEQVQVDQELNELSTANVIAEFHTSMVKTRKRGFRNENDEEANKKGSKLTCAYCSKVFTKNFDLQQHIRSHTGEKPFQCIVCGRCFAQKSNVKKHMHTHKVWPDGLSNTLPKLNRSEEERHSGEGNELSSDVPDEEKEDNSSRETALENSYACPYCTYIGKTYFNLKSHMKEHQTKKVYKCIVSTCSRTFEDLDPFLEHTKSHENEMTYRCHECNKNFGSLYELSSHQYSHSIYSSKTTRASKRTFRCTLCLNKYSTPAALNHHMSTSSHTYSCRHCDKVFPSERYLRRHLLIHADAESFVCKLCSKGFRTEGYLKVHMLTHSSSKPFACTMCVAAFNRKDKLKRHLLIHEPIKRYKCPFTARDGCDREFSRPDKLKAHMLTHSPLKPFACFTCGQTFHHAAQLKKHFNANKTCSDNRENCKWCGQKFQTEKDVLKHKCREILALKKVMNRALPSKPNLLFNRVRRGRSLRKQSPKDTPKKPEETPPPLPPPPQNNDLDDSELVDDIPTAHIEIISTSDELVSVNSMSQFPLPSNFESECEPSQFDDDEAITNCASNGQADSCDGSSFCSIPLQGNSSTGFEECAVLRVRVTVT